MSSSTVRMLIDAMNLDSDRVVDADVCIVGAGPSGISLALTLAAQQFSVILLEGGGLEATTLSSSLYEGKSSGKLVRQGSAYLSESRSRFLGGSSNCWAGMCLPLDALDFATRDWVTGSGWPISEDDLVPYYDRAARYLGISSFRRDPERSSWPAEGSYFRSLEYHLSEPVRFGKRYLTELKEHPKLQVILNANVNELSQVSSGAAVESVIAKSFAGHRITARAKYFVTALGAIENARLLLSSDAKNSNGIGNEHGLVGRFFMEHVRQSIAVLVVRRSNLAAEFGRKRASGAFHDTALAIAPRFNVQQSKGMLNCCVEFLDPKDVTASADSDGRALDHMLSLQDAQPQDVWEVTAFAKFEQPPLWGSRVFLSSERDALGSRKVELEWLESPQHSSTVESLVQLLAVQLASSRLGRLNTSVPWPAPAPSCHHMGTTRMAANPKLGVVDQNCRVFSQDNLFVTGSSVFATSGCANPTFTLMALTQRLADHLLSELGG